MKVLTTRSQVTLPTIMANTGGQRPNYKDQRWHTACNNATCIVEPIT